MIKIRYRNPAALTDVYLRTDWYDADGNIYFDIDNETKINSSKEFQLLDTSNNKYPNEIIVDTSLPATDKNMALLRISMNVEKVDNDYPPHNVDLETGYRTLNQGVLKVKKYTQENTRIEIQLTDKSLNYLAKLNEVYINTLPFGTFEYSNENIIYNHANYSKFNNGDPGYHFGWAWYGQLATKNVISAVDFRPWISALSLLQQACLRVGCKLICPLLETEYGRRIWLYLIDKNFLQSDTDLESIRFSAQIYASYYNLPDRGDYTNIIFPAVNFNALNGYDPNTGEFSAPGFYKEFSVRLKLLLKFSSKSLFGGRDFFNLRLIRKYKDGTFETLQTFEDNNGGGAHQFYDTVTLVAQNIFLQPGESICVQYNNTGGHLNVALIDKFGVFENEPTRKILTIGSTIDVGAILRQDTALDVLKGLAHMFGFIPVTDYTYNKLYLLTAFDLSFFGDAVEGFFTDENRDFKLRQIINSEEYLQAIEITKNRIYSFKKSTCPLIQSKKLDEWEPFGRFVDNGFSKLATDQNEKIENPYFEPTLNDNVLIAQQGVIEAPWLVDNLKGELSSNIAPRICIGYGLKPQYVPHYSNDILAEAASISQYLSDMEANGGAPVIRTLLPLLAQKLNYPTDITGTYPNQEFSTPDAKLVYGTDENDLYQLILYKVWRYITLQPKIPFKAYTTEQQYYEEDFRSRVTINSPNMHTGQISGRIISLGNYDNESDIADAVFIPDTQTLDESVGFTQEQSCKNFVILTYTKVGLVYTFGIDGIITSTPQSVTYRYKQDDERNWHSGNVVTVPTNNFTVEVTVTFDDACPSVTKQVYIIVRLKPEITVTRINDRVTVTAVGTGELTEVVTNIFYSYNNVDYQKYQRELDLTKETTATTLYIIAETEYSGGIVISNTAEMSLTPDETQCPNPDLFVHPPSVIISKVPGQTYFAYKTGYYNGVPAIDKIMYREKNKNQEYTDYNFEILSLQKCWDIVRVIIWKGTQCEPYVSPPVYSDCGACTLNATVAVTPTSEAVTNEQKWENPDDATNTWKVAPINDAIYHKPTIRTYIEQVVGVTPSNVQEFIIQWDRWNYRTEFVYTWNVDYKLNNVQVTTADSDGIGTQITIPLGIKYTSGDANDELEQRIRERIDAYLQQSVGYYANENYILYVAVTGTTTKTLNLGFVAKHNPVNTWLGINKGVDQLEVEDDSENISQVDATGKEFQLVTTAQPVLSNYTEIGTNFKMRFRISTVDYFLDDDASNFNELVPTATPTILTTQLSTAITDSGKKWSLSAALTGCPGTPTFVWLYAGAKKGGSGDTISYDSTCVVHTDSTKEIIVIGHCPTTNYCNYEKRILITA